MFEHTTATEGQDGRNKPRVICRFCRVADADCFNPPREWEDTVLKTAARLVARWDDHRGWRITGLFICILQPVSHSCNRGNRNGVLSKRNKVHRIINYSVKSALYGAHERDRILFTHMRVKCRLYSFYSLNIWWCLTLDIKIPYIKSNSK